MSNNNLYDYSKVKEEQTEKPQKKVKEDSYERTTLYPKVDNKVENKQESIVTIPKRNVTRQRMFTKRRVIIMTIGIVLGLGSLFISSDTFGQATLYPMVFALLIVVSYLFHKDGEVTIFGLLGYILGSYGIVLLIIILSALMMIAFFLAELFGFVRYGG